MKTTQYMHCSMEGTYLVDCQVLGVSKGKYEIKYYDGVIKETVTKFVDSNYLKFPKFGDRVM